MCMKFVHNNYVRRYSLMSLFLGLLYQKEKNEATGTDKKEENSSLLWSSMPWPLMPKKKRSSAIRGSSPLNHFPSLNQANKLDSTIFF